MLAHDRKTLVAEKSKRNTPDTPTEATLRIPTEADAYDTDQFESDDFDQEQFAHDEFDETVIVRPPSVTARPLIRQESRIVNKTSKMLAARSQLEDDEAENNLLPALMTTPEPLAVTIVTGNSTSKMVAMRVAPPPRKQRHWASGIVILTLTLAISMTAIATATPLGSGQSTGVVVHTNGPMGLPIALDAVNKAPTGQWVAVVGMQPNQDLGGGAGPGVKAPGSAGLPGSTGASVASVQVNVNTGAPASGDIGYISAAPFTPWPPSDPYAYVPGYGAYAMSDVGGYYSWSFGQCTWWAQYERKDENLMHMGNAQYWAGGARARGYQVGWQAQSGATVVFQPGVQGAGGAGHVAHVVKVYPNGWFLISEMNFYWNGGGWGRVDYRLAHEGSGVQFIY